MPKSAKDRALHEGDNSNPNDVYLLSVIKNQLIFDWHMLKL